jgi:hypothetical protein
MYFHEASKWYDIKASVDGITWETQRMTGGQPVFIIKEQTVITYLWIFFEFISSDEYHQVLCT